MRLLIDEDSQARLLIAKLMAAGHDVVTANEAGLTGLADEIVLSLARELGRVLLTHNCSDFLSLHEQSPEHPGILAVYQERDATKNMGYDEIVHALGKLEASGLSIPGGFHALNHWR